MRMVLFSLPVIAVIFLFQACDEGIPGEYVIADGVPTVYYIRMSDPQSADSLIVAAYMDNTICLIGDNLNSIHEIYFNDQKAILNNSLITKNTLFVNIPKNIPEVVTNKIYMISGSGDTVDYDFSVLVPAPIIVSISCEYAHDGDAATLYGDYFIDDTSSPLTITMAGNIPVTEITSVSKQQVSFVIPEGAQKGYINVKSMYGTSRSKFQFRDDRGIILDYDILTTSGSWRGGLIANDENSLDGNYLILRGEVDDNVGAEDYTNGGFVSELWSDANGRTEGNFFDGDVADFQLKFEANVINWSGAYLNICFGPWGSSVAPYQNQLYWSDINARGLWRPWENTSTGSFKSNGWITVTIPMKDIKYNKDFDTMEFDKSLAGSLSLWMKGPAATSGGKCIMEVYFDNIRIVPAE